VVSHGLPPFRGRQRIRLIRRLGRLQRLNSKVDFRKPEANGFKLKIHTSSDNSFKRSARLASSHEERSRFLTTIDG
jgi:hypothetical protein